jgi:cellobiose phosphorylase
VYAQMVAGKDAFKQGEAKNSWLTGAAAWNFVAISQWILGIKPGFDGLVVDPCIPPAWNEFEAQRWYQGSLYKIHCCNPQHVSRGIHKVVVDGNELRGNTLPVFRDGKTHEVEITLGAGS